MRRTTLLVLCALAVTLLAGNAFAGTTYPDTLKVDYFINAVPGGGNSGIALTSAVVQLTNTGTTGGNLCADVFVYDKFQEISECGSCLTTPNDLRTLSVNVDLTENPLTGVFLNTGSIRIVSAATHSGTCPLPTSGIVPTAGIRAWATHIQTGNQITETPSQDEILSAAELGALQNGCFAISLAGSGRGILTCGTGE
jgi:hypothetical protein